MSNLIAFVTSFILIVCAEMGDKTQLLVINFASKYRVYKVLVGIFIGALCSNAIAILIGTYINNVAGIDKIIQLVASLIFILFGIFNALEFRNDKKEEKGNFKIFSSVIVTVALSIFLGELGDKTNLSTLALTTQFDQGYIYILLGATLAMVVSNVLSIFIGSVIQKRLPPKALNVLSTGLFMLFGVIGLTGVCNQYVPNFFYTSMFCVVVSILCIYICKRVYMPKTEKYDWV